MCCIKNQLMLKSIRMIDINYTCSRAAKLGGAMNTKIARRLLSRTLRNPCRQHTVQEFKDLSPIKSFRLRNFAIDLMTSSPKMRDQ